jgi:ATP synthase mitochondrial F1 complex assembly factor 1
MASFRVPALRHVISGAAPYLRLTQRRWAQVHDVRFLATKQSSRVIDKYKEKLDKKAKEYGLLPIHEIIADDFVCSIVKACEM